MRFSFQVSGRPSPPSSEEDLERSQVHALPYHISTPLSNTYRGPSMDMARGKPGLRANTAATWSSASRRAGSLSPASTGSDSSLNSPDSFGSKYPASPVLRISDKVTIEMYEKQEPSPTESEGEEYGFYGTVRFWCMFVALCINVIMFALDQLIVTVAVPQIVDQFQALEKLAWLNTGFFVPCAAGILIYSQLMTIWSPRWVYLCALLIFEIGSAVCGSASSMDMLIFGRALTGLGGAGMWNATYLILTELVPFAKRGPIFSILGTFYMLASVMGTLVGGAFTSMSPTGWRWCFYVNLPIGGLTIVLFAVFSPRIRIMLPFDGVRDERAWWRKLLRIDWVGALLTLAFVTTLGIGTQWGGISKAWSDIGVIAAFAACALSFGLLIVWSYFMGPRAMLPLSLFKSGHFTAATWVSFFAFGTTVNISYFLSVFFQAIKNTSAIRTGTLLLGLQGSLGVFLIGSTKVAERCGHAKLPMVIGSVFAAIALGIMTTLTKDTPTAVIVGLEIFAGAGLGMVLNLMTVIMQAAYRSTKHVTLHATNVFNFWGFVGRIIGLSVATNVFENKLKHGLGNVGGIKHEVGAMVFSSPTAVWSANISDALRETLLHLYAGAISHIWWVSTATALMLVMACMQLDDLRVHAAAAEDDEEVAKTGNTKADLENQA